MKVDVSEQIEDLASDKLNGYDLLMLNYCNWKRPGLSEDAKAGFAKYLQNGGGLCLLHFANGAFHFSLPEAGDSDWPEYRRICRRVWDHTAGKSGHDRYGKFIVEIETQDHPVTRGMEAFETIDELYYRQQGDEPITVLAKARSRDTGEFAPQAFVYDYGKGRVFQTVLGHSAESIETTGTSELIRRGAAWVARREQVPARERAESPKQEAADILTEGRFGKALDARRSALYVAGKGEYRQPPMTVECWAKIRSRESFNIVVANELKSSATHWELFSFAGTGHFTAYLPGREPDHVRRSISAMTAGITLR